MYLEDYGNPGDNVSDAVERLFKEHYLGHLGAAVCELLLSLAPFQAC